MDSRVPSGENAIVVETDSGIHVVELDAVASWGALLDATDEEALEYIVYVAEHGEPAPDPSTGRNAWTSAYEQLKSDMNQEAKVMAVSNARNGIDETRAALGLPPRHEKIAIMSVNAENKYNDIIADHAEKISVAREKFLASLKEERLD